MRKGQLLISALLLILLLAACAPQAAPASQAPAPAAAPAPARAAPVAPAKPAWEIEWDRVLAEAKKEGKVVITTDTGSAVRVAIAEGFKKAYGIPVESIGGRVAEIVARVLAERKAGLYNYDVFVSGSTPALTQLKPTGAIDPMDRALILPDVTDPETIKKIWWPGKLWWVDDDHTHLAPALRLNFPVAINTQLVKEGEIKSYRDLLDSKWQGKLILNDPSTPGVGASFLTFVVSTLGWDYVEKLANAKPIVMRDQRQMIEWLAHGKASVVAAPQVATLTEFINLGAPIKGLVPAEGTWLVGGTSNLSLYNKSPHPNAAKTFINWYLSREGQTIVVTTSGSQSNRLDVTTDHLSPEQTRQSEGKYFLQEDEKIIQARPAQIKRAGEIFGPLMK